MRYCMRAYGFVYNHTKTLPTGAADTEKIASMREMHNTAAVNIKHTICYYSKIHKLTCLYKPAGDHINLLP